MPSPESLGMHSEHHDIEKEDYESKFEKKGFGHDVENAARRYLDSLENIKTIKASDYEDEIKKADFYVQVGDLEPFGVQFTTMTDPRETKNKSYGELSKEDQEKVDALEEKKRRAEEQKDLVFVHARGSKYGPSYEEYEEEKKQKESNGQEIGLEKYFDRTAEKETVRAFSSGCSSGLRLGKVKNIEAVLRAK